LAHLLQPAVTPQLAVTPAYYRFSIANNGNVPIRRIVLVDELPKRFTVDKVEVQEVRRGGAIFACVLLF